MGNIERGLAPHSKLEQKEGRFHGGVKFSPQELFDETNAQSPRGTRLITSLVITEGGEPKIKRGLYKSSVVPEKIDPANFDYDDNAMAEYYDSNPEITLVDIDVSRADALLAKRENELEIRIKEFNDEFENADDEMESEQIEMALSDIEHDLEQVKTLRVKLKKAK